VDVGDVAPIITGVDEHDGEDVDDDDESPTNQAVTVVTTLTEIVGGAASLSKTNSAEGEIKWESRDDTSFTG